MLFYTEHDLICGSLPTHLEKKPTNADVKINFSHHICYVTKVCSCICHNYLLGIYFYNPGFDNSFCGKICWLHNFSLSRGFLSYYPSLGGQKIIEYTEPGKDWKFAASFLDLRDN